MSAKPNPMETFCASLSQVVNTALSDGVNVPNAVMVLEMTKIELANEHIARMRMEMMQAHAKSIADATPKIESGKIITP